MNSGFNTLNFINIPLMIIAILIGFFVLPAVAWVDVPNTGSTILLIVVVSIIVFWIFSLITSIIAIFRKQITTIDGLIISLGLIIFALVIIFGGFILL